MHPWEIGVYGRKDRLELAPEIAPIASNEMTQQLLIIDDSPLIHALVRARLGGEPVRITGAESGAQGLELARNSPPDLILLDVDMPEMDGFEVCRQLKADPTIKHVPVVFLTAAATPDQKLRGLELGATDYIAKPFDPAELKARVRASLRSERIMALERRRSRVLEMIAANRPLAEVLLALIELAEQSFPSAYASAAILTSGRLEQVAPNLPDEFKAALLKHWSTLAAGGGITLDAADGISCSNPSIDPQWLQVREAAAKSGLETCWAVPIRPSTGTGSGMFALYHRGSVELNESARTLLETITKLASIASQHRELTHQLSHLAHHDPLTGLPNRMLFEDRLAQALARLPRTAGQLGLFCIDLDRFKHVNDTLGHDAGDAILREFANRASQVLRPTDTLARIGGDEFLLIVGEIGSHPEAMEIARRVMDCVSNPFQFGQHTICITASIGVALSPDHGTVAPDLEKKADVAMYRAKSLGRNGCETFSAEMLSSSAQRLAIESRLRHAVQNRELELHYQPQFGSDDGLIGFEAMVRWNHPDLGLLPPVAFIPVAEETGLIVGIGTWVLEEACRQSRQWQLAGYEPVKIAVNVSAVQLERADFAGIVLGTLRRHNIEPRWLELELTETLLMKASPETIDKLRELRALGILISLDDFGTGHSSLAYLHQLPIDCLKTDRSFVQRVNAGADVVDSTPVLEAILSLGHSLGMKVLAEGVEELHQLQAIKRLGFDAVQGFYRGRPQPAADVKGLLRRMTQAPVHPSPLPLSA
jgi:diguanylate cyclase (GGDEF)-like protein